MSETPQARPGSILQDQIVRIGSLIDNLAESSYRLRAFKRRMIGEDSDLPPKEVGPTPPYGAVPSLEHYISELSKIDRDIEAEVDALEGVV